MTGHEQRTEDLLRELTPSVLGALLRRHHDFDRCEDALQEAMATAVAEWPEAGVPDHPHGWLVTVATRRLIDAVRSDTARARREAASAAAGPDEEAVTPAEDDTLALFFLCCHPSLTQPSQIALTLRAVGGLTTAEIAAAFLVPEPTMAQRISRAKAALRRLDRPFGPPPLEDRSERMPAVLHVLYLVFNEGYAASAGTHLMRPELSSEAIRLVRVLRRAVSDDPEIEGLLALMLLTDARRPARVAPDGGLVPIDEQDRSRWDHDAIVEGVALISHTLTTARALGLYQLQAAIAAVHDEAESAAATDWGEIASLYRLLERVAPGPMVTLNRAVAVSELDGPDAGLAILDGEQVTEALSGHHRLHAVRGHLLERAGHLADARAEYRAAARRTTSLAERRYLESRIRRLDRTSADAPRAPRAGEPRVGGSLAR